MIAVDHVVVSEDNYNELNEDILREIENTRGALSEALNKIKIVWGSLHRIGETTLGYKEGSGYMKRLDGLVSMLADTTACLSEGESLWLEGNVVMEDVLKGKKQLEKARTNLEHAIVGLLLGYIELHKFAESVRFQETPIMTSIHNIFETISDCVVAYHCVVKQRFRDLSHKMNFEEGMINPEIAEEMVSAE
jgi:hypothetical protein